MIKRDSFVVDTPGRGIFDITARVAAVVAAAGGGDALCHVFCHHTSASLVLCENADPVVRRDLEAYFARAVVDGDRLFQHVDEGDDDMPAHVRTVMTGSDLTLPVARGRLDLGTWQGVYLWEHRTSPHHRRITITVLT